MEQVKEEQLENGEYNGVGIYPKVFMKANLGRLELFTYVRKKYNGEEYLVAVRERNQMNGNYDIKMLQEIKDRFIILADRVVMNAVPIERDGFSIQFIKITK